MGHYRLLGDVRAGPPHAPLALGGTRQRATLAMLLMNPNRFVSDDHLIAGVAVDEPGSLGSLRTFVSGLRRVLGPVIERRGTGYVIIVDEAEIDLTQFRVLVTRAREARESLKLAVAAELLLDALALWQGPVLGGLERLNFYGDTAPALVEERAVATDLRFAVDLALGRHEQCLPDLWVAAAAEPLRERRWGQLILALYRSGERVEALRAYSRVRYKMTGELGLDLGPNLRRLESEILNESVGLDWQPPPERRAGRYSVSPPRELICRRHELDRLYDIVHTSGGRGAVVVRGEAGMGKSVLVRAFIRLMRSEGAVVLTAGCTPDAPSVFGVIRETLEGVEHLATASGAELADLSVILPGIHVSREGDTGALLPPSQDRVLAAANELLGHVAGTSPCTVLVIEDMQWADGPTKAFVDIVLHSSSQIFVILSTRDPAGRSTESRDRDVNLQALSEKETAELWNELGVHQSVATDAKTIHLVTGGIPFYITELARSQRAGVGIEAALPADASQSHRGILKQRLDGLGMHLSGLLIAIAIAGPPVRVYELSAMTGQDVVGLVEALQPAVDAGVLVVKMQAQMEYGFAHDLIREHVAAMVSAPKAAVLHVAAATAISGDETSQALLRRWRHLTLAAGLVSPPELFSAARAAFAALERSGAIDEAEEVCVTTLAIAGESYETAAELLVRLAVLFVRAGRPNAARAALDRGASAARTSGAHHLLIDVMRASDPFDPALSGDPRRAGTVREALHLLGSSPTATRLSGLVALSVAEHRQGRSSNARALLDEAAKCAQALDTPAASGIVGHLRHLLDRSSTVRGQDETQRSLATARAIDQAVRSGDLTLITATAADALTDALEFGTLDKARTALHTLRTYASQADSPMPLWVAACAEAVLAQGAGEFGHAERLAAAAAALGRQHGIGLVDAALDAYHLVDGILRDDFTRFFTSVAVVIGRDADAPAWAFAAALARARSGDLSGARRIIDATGGVVRLPDDWLRLAGLMLAGEATALAGGHDDPWSLIALLDPWVGSDVVVGTAMVSLGPVQRVTGLLHAAIGANENAAAHLIAAAEKSRDRGMHAWSRLALTAALPQAQLAHNDDLLERATALSTYLSQLRPVVEMDYP